MAENKDEYGSNTCAICMEIIQQNDRIIMPCCGITSSSVQFCRHCIQTIADTGFQNTIGKCPTCSSLFRITEGKPESIADNVLQCTSCRQLRQIADPQHRLCAACVIGIRYIFHYECIRCHGTQQIPHPMWNYQPTPNEFGTATWACRRCGDYTHWRIIDRDAANIPPEHTPESWGQRDVWLEAVRVQSLARRGPNLINPNANPNDDLNGERQAGPVQAAEARADEINTNGPTDNGAALRRAPEFLFTGAIVLAIVVAWYFGSN